MTTPAVERLMNDARLQLPGVLDAGLQQELFNVLDDFCQTTRAWKEKITVNVSAGETEYELVPSDPGAIVSLIALVDENDVDVAGTMELPGTLILARETSTDTTYTATVAMTVVDPVSGGYPQAPEWFYQSYRNVLLDGLVGRMMSQIAKPWSNERLAVFHLRGFRNGMARARIEALHQNIQGGQRWSFPQNFAPCRR